MSPAWFKYVSASKDVALAISLLFNFIACAAVWRLWKSREAMQDKVSSMLKDLVSELTRMTVRLVERER